MLPTRSSMPIPSPAAVAVAVNLVAATQRPTQKAMGQGAVRSQMDVRISFRVRERKDVDLILGQGMPTSSTPLASSSSQPPNTTAPNAPAPTWSQIKPSKPPQPITPTSVRRSMMSPCWRLKESPLPNGRWFHPPRAPKSR